MQHQQTCGDVCYLDHIMELVEHVWKRSASDEFVTTESYVADFLIMNLALDDCATGKIPLDNMP